MPFGKKDNKQKHSFSPGAHGTVYFLGAIYLAYLLVTFLQQAYRGGEDAPSLPLLVGGTLVLGGGTVLLALMAWKMSRTPPKTEELSQEDTDDGQAEEPPPDEADDWDEDAPEEGENKKN